MSNARLHGCKSVDERCSCSLKCYKIHKPTHENDSSLVNADQVQQPIRDRPGTTQRVPKVSFTGFENDLELNRLLTRYPALRVQLQAVYALTLEPGLDDARSWNRRPLPDFHPAEHSTRRGRGISRGRSSFRSRGARRAGYSGPSATDGREHGAWTHEKGDKEALKVMKQMRGTTNDSDEVSEGIREFVELCQIRFGEGAKTV